MFFKRLLLTNERKIRLSFATVVIFCASLDVSYAQIIGAGLAADISVGSADGQQKNKKSTIFPLASTVFSLSEELQFKPGKTVDQNNYIAKAEFWSKGAWGVSGNIQQNADNLFGLPKDSDSKRIDVNRKILQAQNSDSFLALGFGWQSFDIDQGSIDSDGLNLSLLGKYSFTENFNLYGNGSLFQSIDNNDFHINAKIALECKYRSLGVINNSF